MEGREQVSGDVKNVRLANRCCHSCLYLFVMNIFIICGLLKRDNMTFFFHTKFSRMISH